tara:strand:- start:65 stop:292 length:228 start_codon:yes stop_codon:yes gene_type:complete
MNVPDLSNLDLSKAKTIRCESCENATFEQTIMLHKFSALISPNGQETIVPAAVFACSKCGFVNKEFVKADLTTQQ